jgi:hypothetical protein
LGGLILPVHDFLFGLPEDYWRERSRRQPVLPGLRDFARIQ